MTSPRPALLVSQKLSSAAALQLRDTRPGAVFVLLRGAAADAAGPFDNAVANNRNGPLTHDNVAARGGGDAARGRLIGPLGQFAINLVSHLALLCGGLPSGVAAGTVAASERGSIACQSATRTDREPRMRKSRHRYAVQWRSVTGWRILGLSIDLSALYPLYSIDPRAV